MLIWLAVLIGTGFAQNPVECKEYALGEWNRLSCYKQNEIVCSAVYVRESSSAWVQITTEKLESNTFVMGLILDEKLDLPRQDTNKRLVKSLQSLCKNSTGSNSKPYDSFDEEPALGITSGYACKIQRLKKKPQDGPAAIALQCSNPAGKSCAVVYSTQLRTLTYFNGKDVLRLDKPLPISEKELLDLGRGAWKKGCVLPEQS